MKTALIRNFCIIAHIDHGKSTLADRLLELTGTISQRESVPQYLDKMDLERERGITIKAHTVTMNYQAKDGNLYQLNLIDTPGHVDFTYEVSRSLAACEGAILVIDASQGIQAQTIANVYLALENNLEILPVINKIDLANADVPSTLQQIKDILGLDPSLAIPISAKSGKGVANVLEAIIRHFPPPQGQPTNPLKALIFDSWFDSYLGVVVLIRVLEGEIKPKMKILMISTKKIFEVQKVGFFSPNWQEKPRLSAGNVGFATATIKNVKDTQIGDTITSIENPTPTPLFGFRPAKPMVFAGIYPLETAQYLLLREALEKLSLNDSAFSFEGETSQALGFGFRCGFLGLLHLDVFRERLEREYQLDLIVTAPSVIYRITTTKGQEFPIDNPAKMPPTNEITLIKEPFIAASIHAPTEFIGNILKLCEERRGVQNKLEYLTPTRTIIHYELPLNEIVFDFYDKLKSITQGYASLDYEFLDYRESNLVKLDILINGDLVDALSVIVHKDKAYYRGRELIKKMRGYIPRQLFEVAIQAAIGNRVIARESIKALRKDVTAKCYGGDITRKRKLLEKQKAGKKRMKRLGKVDIPQDVFLAVLKVD